MGKAARFACIILPMLTTLASLLCCLAVLLAGTNKSIKGLNTLYLVKLDTRNIADPQHLDLIPGVKFDNKFVDTGVTISQELDLQDFYATYLWNYCEGKIEGKNWYWESCAKPSFSYTFDIEKIVDSETSKDNQISFPDSVKKVQKGINGVSKFMVACYVLGFVASDMTFIVGWFGLLSRWGSCVTTIFANVAFLFLLIGSCCATGLTYGLKGAFNKAFDEFGVEAFVGNNFMVATWASTGLAFVACLFWLMSTCCCSGKTSKVMDKKGKGRTKVERAPYTYERVASPYLGTSGPTPVSQPHGVQPGFEPLRHA